jgi:uncharacterized alkaline shock family protein YloU
MSEELTVMAYRMASSVLEAIVRGAVAGNERMRVHQGGGIMRPRGLEVTVEGESCRVHLPLESRFGEVLPVLGSQAQQRVAEALSHMTGLRVTAVDVQFVGVFPAGGAPA